MLKDMVRFQAERVLGKGWTVVKITGTKRTGRTIERAQGFESLENYTLAQAQVAADAMRRSFFK